MTAIPTRSINQKYLSRFDLDRVLLEEGMIEYLGMGEDKINYEEFDSRTFCPICLIKKQSKVRHVKKLNLCVKDFHFYSKFFDKIVFGKNHYLYLLTLALNFTTIALLFCLTLHAYRVKNQQYFMMFFVEFLDVPMSVFSKLTFILNTALLLSLGIDILIQVVCALSNLTYDELLRPQHYPYLYKKINGKAFYRNPNDFGLIKNLKLFIRRLI